MGSERHPSLLSWNVTVCTIEPVFWNSMTSPTTAFVESGSKTRLSVAWMVWAVVALPSEFAAAVPLQLWAKVGPPIAARASAAGEQADSDTPSQADRQRTQLSHV